MKDNRDELIEKAIEQMLTRDISAEDVAQIYDLSTNEIELPKAAKRISSVPSPVFLSRATRKRMLRKILNELKLKPAPGIFKKVAISFSTLVVATGGISYAAYKAPPDSFLYKVRDVVEEATFIFSPGKEEKAKRILESVSNHAELARKYREKNRAASQKAYETAKKRLNEYLELKRSLKSSRDLSDFEKKAGNKYIEAKRKIAPRETTIILEIKKEKPSSVKPLAPRMNSDDKKDQGSPIKRSK